MCLAAGKEQDLFNPFTLVLHQSALVPLEANWPSRARSPEASKVRNAQQRHSHTQTLIERARQRSASSAFRAPRDAFMPCALSIPALRVLPIKKKRWPNAVAQIGVEPPDRATGLIHPSPDLRFIKPNRLSSSLASTACLARQLSCEPCLCREHRQHAGADCLPAGHKRERSRRTTHGAGPFSRERRSGPVGIGAPRSSKSGEDSAASSLFGVVRAC